MLKKKPTKKPKKAKKPPSLESIRQDRFAFFYVRYCGNAGKAARAIGCPPAGAYVTAHRMLKNAKVLALIKKYRKEVEGPEKRKFGEAKSALWRCVDDYDHAADKYEEAIGDLEGLLSKKSNLKDKEKIKELKTILRAIGTLGNARNAARRDAINASDKLAKILGEYAPETVIHRMVDDVTDVLIKAVQIIIGDLRLALCPQCRSKSSTGDLVHSIMVKMRELGKGEGKK